jgi:hypothetical protein
MRSRGALAAGAMMSPMRPSVTAVARFRRHRRAGVWLFVALLCLVAAERRLAEVHYNRHTVAPAFESDAVLDADEVRVRLIVLNDHDRPSLPDVSGTIAFETLHALAPHPDSPALGRPAPRGPPRLLAS